MGTVGVRGQDLGSRLVEAPGVVFGTPAALKHSPRAAAVRAGL